jgi:hypothetical protein
MKSHSTWQTTLLAFALLCSFTLTVLSLLPRDTWRDFIVQSSHWGPCDDADLSAMRMVLLGWGIVILGWSLVLDRNRIRWLSSRDFLVDALRLVIIVGTAAMVARVFIVFHDHVRLVGFKSIYSDWGEFLGMRWVVPHQPYTDRDYFNSLFLASAGIVALFMTLLRSQGLVRTRKEEFPAVLWGMLAFAFLWASIDELVMIHEFLGPNLPILRDTHITKWPDDVIMLCYAAGGIAVFTIFFRYFWGRKGALALFIGGICCQTLASLNDVHGIVTPEESLEMYGGLFYFSSMFWYAYCEIRDAFAAGVKASTH